MLVWCEGPWRALVASLFCSLTHSSHFRISNSRDRKSDYKGTARLPVSNAAVDRVSAESLQERASICVAGSES
jgi:hypothetical protein